MKVNVIQSTGKMKVLTPVKCTKAMFVFQIAFLIYIEAFGVKGIEKDYNTYDTSSAKTKQIW